MNSPPPGPESLSLAGPAGALEAIVEVPAAFDGRRCAVICHPHPLFGGTLTNKVVYMTARALQERGYATLRFNFRGVGGSEGHFDDGRGETQDALAACDYLCARFPQATLSLAGFSFGSYVAFRVALQRELRELIVIAPPVRRFDFATPVLPKAPWVVIQGDADDVVECADVVAWVSSLSPAPGLEIIAGAGHFFHGRLSELKDVVKASLV